MEMKQKKRLLFAAVDIGWRIEHYTEFLTKQFGDKLKVESFVKFKLPRVQKETSYTFEFNFYKYSKIVQWELSFLFFIYALFRYDVFYFFSGETLLTYALRPFELRIYRLFGKKIIMHFVGADIRNSGYLFWLNHHFEEYLNGNKLEGAPTKHTTKQRKLVMLAERFADKVFVSTPDLLEFFSTKENVHWIPVFLHERKFLEELRSAKPYVFSDQKVRILFAPSNGPLKGADYVVSQVNKWSKNKTDIEFLNMLDEKWTRQMKPFPPYVLTHVDLLSYLQSVDIVIDQVLIGWYGLLAVESMYLNKVTICYIANDLKRFLSPTCPIISFEKDIMEALDKAYEIVKTKKDNDYQSFVLEYHTLEKSKWVDLIKEVIF
jgi:hypothetical protein